MEKIVLHVEGMACGHCEIAVQDAVRKLPGIKKVKATKRFIILKAKCPKQKVKCNSA